MIRIITAPKEKVCFIVSHFDLLLHICGACVYVRSWRRLKRTNPSTYHVEFGRGGVEDGKERLRGTILAENIYHLFAVLLTVPLSSSPSSSHTIRFPLSGFEF